MSTFYEFGPYRIDTAEQRLLRADEPIPLTPKAYEVLLALVENAGHGLEKHELMQRVWPDTFVEESSLSRNISVLRKVLGDDDGQYIETLPKRGYRFVAPVRQLPLPGDSLIVEEHAVTRMVVSRTESTSWTGPAVRVAMVLALVSVVAGLAFWIARQARLARLPTQNREAYENYLKGLDANEAPRASGRARIEAAIARFRKATELDPSYAQAWAQLASCYDQLANFYEPDSYVAEEARYAANRAYALDPHLPELLVVRAQGLWSWNSHYQMEEAIRELRRGAHSDLSAVDSLLGILYSHVGLDEQAITALKRAIEIDPANSLHQDRLGQVYVWAGRSEDAQRAYARAFAIEPEAQGTLHFSAIPLLYEHQFEEARRRLEGARSRDPRNVVLPAYFALLEALEGRFQQAEGAIPPDDQEMGKFRDGHHAFYAFASIYALEGKNVEAVRWLRRTAETGMPNYPMFARDPHLDRVRSSREFTQFMAELKPRYEALEREFR